MSATLSSHDAGEAKKYWTTGQLSARRRYPMEVTMARMAVMPAAAIAGMLVLGNNASAEIQKPEPLPCKQFFKAADGSWSPKTQIKMIQGGVPITIGPGLRVTTRRLDNRFGKRSRSRCCIGSRVRSRCADLTWESRLQRELGRLRSRPSRRASGFGWMDWRSTRAANATGSDPHRSEGMAGGHGETATTDPEEA